MSVDSGRGDEVCSSDSSVGSLTDSVALDVVTTENIVEHDTDSTADIAMVCVNCAYSTWPTVMVYCHGLRYAGHFLLQCYM